MHVGIAHPRWRGKRSRHSRRMRTRNFAYLSRGPLGEYLLVLEDSGDIEWPSTLQYEVIYVSYHEENIEKQSYKDFVLRRGAEIFIQLHGNWMGTLRRWVFPVVKLVFICLTYFVNLHFNGCLNDILNGPGICVVYIESGLDKCFLCQKEFKMVWTCRNAIKYMQYTTYMYISLILTNLPIWPPE